MKTAKAKCFMFDLECPYCDGLLASPEGNGSLSWSTNESTPPTAVCVDCEKTSKIPRRIPGAKIIIDKDYK